jgi:hypothetical protein
VADRDDATSRLDDLDVLARHHGVVPAFRWPEHDDGELEGCFLRLWRDDPGDDGLIVFELGALDGSWTEQFLVGAEHLEAAVSGPAELGPSS